MDEQFVKKFRNLITSCPKLGSSYSELLTSNDSTQQASLLDIRKLTYDFLALVSGDDIINLMDDVLSPREKEEVPALGSVDDPKGSKRLSKLNGLLRKSPPLNPWHVRTKNDKAVRLEIELTARRSLIYLSGGQMLALLDDILYPDEKDIFCTKYRSGMVKIGDAIRNLSPKAKAFILSGLRQVGFTKDELRDMNWTFSNSLWNVGALATGLSPEDLASLSVQPHDSGYFGPKRIIERTSSTYTTTTRTLTTSGRPKRRKARKKKRNGESRKQQSHPFGVHQDEDGSDYDDAEDVSPPYQREASRNAGQGAQNRIYLNNFVIQDGSGTDEDSKIHKASERNPMFPQIAP